MVVSLGPTSMSPFARLNIPKNPRSDGTGPNPRCLRRDINRNAAMGATADRAYSLITNNSNIDGFYNQLLGNPPPKNDLYPWGVSINPYSLLRNAEANPRVNNPPKHQIHTAGHYIHAVDPGGDPATSPGDPVFYFHHGALDRLWWIWQMQDPDKRLNAVPTGRGASMPDMPGMGGGSSGPDPSKAVIDLEWLAGPIPLLEAHDQLGGNGGAFCYIYV